jgi:hypothetical protein
MLRKELDKKRNSLKLKSSHELIEKEDSIMERVNSNVPGNIEYKTPSLSVNKPQTRSIFNNLDN